MGVGMKVLRASRELVETHYSEHVGRPFYPGLVEYVTSGPVVAMVWRGRNSIKAVRKLRGATDPVDAGPGTIRGDLAMDKTRNLCHASDSLEAAVREVGLWFQEKELVVWEPVVNRWLHGE